MSMIKSPAEIALMREAGRVVANTLAKVREAAAVGVSLKELDELAAASIADAGATPAFLNYRPRWASVPFPGVICTSVNDAVVHGIPNDYRLQDGDLLSVDCGAFLEGWCGDAAVSFIVGTADPADQALIEADGGRPGPRHRGRPDREQDGRPGLRDRRGLAPRRLRTAGRPRRPRDRQDHARRAAPSPMTAGRAAASS